MANQKQLVQVTDEDFTALSELRNVLNQNAQESIQKASPYMAGIYTELLSQVEKELTRVSRFSGRMSVAAMRRQVKQLRTTANPAKSTQAKTQSA